MGKDTLSGPPVFFVDMDDAFTGVTERIEPFSAERIYNRAIAQELLETDDLAEVQEYVKGLGYLQEDG